MASKSGSRGRVEMDLAVVRRVVKECVWRDRTREETERRRDMTRITDGDQPVVREGFGNGTEGENAAPNPDGGHSAYAGL